MNFPAAKALLLNSFKDLLRQPLKPLIPRPLKTKYTAVALNKQAIFFSHDMKLHPVASLEPR
jgi:hypothetical protein